MNSELRGDAKLFRYRQRYRASRIGSFVCAATLLASFLWLLVSCGGGGASGGGTTFNACGETGTDPECHTLASGGRTRAYLLHVPSNFQPGTGALVLVLHGLGQTGLEMEQLSGANAMADQEGFAIAYPYALIAQPANIAEWNNFFDEADFGNNPPDDVGFLSQLVSTLETQIHPDPKKIYFAGVSDGALMSYRVGIERSNMVAAVGTVIGTLYGFGGNLQSVPPAIGPVSVLILHGDQDTVVPYCGVTGWASQDQTFDYWTGPSANNCSSVDTTAPLCDAQGNVTAVFEKDATGCRGKSEVRFYRLEGGTHSWYTNPMNVSGQIPYNPDFNATTGITEMDILWKFFASHPKP
jgi:polyhydroxybutyrate depolymerase